MPVLRGVISIVSFTLLFMNRVNNTESASSVFYIVLCAFRGSFLFGIDYGLILSINTYCRLFESSQNMTRNCVRILYQIISRKTKYVLL